MAKVGASRRGRSRVPFVWMLSLISSVWTTPLLLSLIGDQSLMMLALAYAATVTVGGLFLVARPRKSPVRLLQKEKILESPPEQYA